MTVESATPEDLLRHAHWLRALALRLARDEASADDLVQDTWAFALRRRPGRDGLGTWLARAMERLARHGRRGEHRRRHRETIAASRDVGRSDAELEEAFDAQRHLASVVDELPAAYRTLILRRYYDGESAAEIARRTGVPAATVRSQLARARALLRRRWNTRDDDARHRGLAGLALVAGVVPETLQGGAVMKTSHAVLLTAACALALALVAGRGVLTPGADRRGAEAGDDVELVRIAPRAEDDEEAQLGEAKVEGAREVAALPPGTVQVADAVASTRLLARIVDESGRPVAGARLDCPDRNGYGEAASDDLGRLALETERELVQIWQGRAVPVRFRVRANGRETIFLRAALERDADTDLGDLVLGPGGDVVGRVVDVEGRPMPGARILAADAAIGGAPEAARRSGPRGDGPRIEATSGDDGTYRLEGVAAGPARVWARVTGRPWQFTPALEIAAAADTRAPDIVLSEAAPDTVIAGVVIGPDGSPVERAVVLASGLSAGVIRYERAVADDEGRFTVLAFDRGPHRVGAFHPDAELTPKVESRVLPGTDDLELKLTALRLSEVSFVDDRDGSPISMPWIHLEQSGSMDMARGAPRRDDEALGPGKLRVALPSSTFTITASATGYDYRSIGPFEPETFPEAFEIRLEAKPMIRGRVLANGAPVAGARVQTMRDMTSVFSITTQGFRTRLFDGGAYSTETDEDGRFEHPVSTALPSGDHVVVASKDGWASAELVVEIDENGAEGVELVLTEGGSIEGLVSLPSDRDPRGAIVAASNGDGNVRTTRADEDGHYRLDHLAPGPWEVHHREDDEQFFMTQSAAPPDGPFEGDCIVVEGRTTRHDVDVRGTTRRIDGRLVIDGEPAAGWTARLEDAEALFQQDVAGSSVLDASGSFSLAVEGGVHRLVLETSETSSAFVRVSRAIGPDHAGEETTLEVVTGTVRGTAPKGARVRLSASFGGGWSYLATVEADEHGAFTARTPPGRVTIAVERAEPGKFTRFVDATVVDVKTGATVDVEIE